MGGWGVPVVSKYCHTLRLFVCWFLGVFCTWINKKSIFCTGSYTVVQKKSVSRICAPVKMQINLFVRSTGLVSGLFGAVGHRRASASSAAQRAAARGWAASRGEVEQSLQSAGQRTLVQPNVLQRFLRGGTDSISPQHNTVTSLCLIQVKVWGKVPRSRRGRDNGHVLYWRHQLCQMAAGFGLAVLKRHFRAWSLLTSEMSRVPPHSNALSHWAAVRHMLAVRFGLWSIHSGLAGRTPVSSKV